MTGKPSDSLRGFLMAVIYLALLIVGAMLLVHEVKALFEEALLALAFSVIKCLIDRLLRMGRP